jgi:hypothetical protein
MRFEFEIKRLGKLKIETILAAGVTEKDARRAAKRGLSRNERLGSVIWLQMGQDHSPADRGKYAPAR